MKKGAGIILICPFTNRILLALRSDARHKWSNFGGMVEKTETPIQTAKRELFEEAGFIEEVHYNLASSDPVYIANYGIFSYITYIGIVNKEITATLNYEHIKSNWFLIDDLPDNLHNGIKNLLNDAKAVNFLKKYMIF